MLRGSPSPDDSPAPDDRLPSPDASSLRPRPNTVSNRLYGGAGLSARAGCARMLRAAPGVEDHEVVDVLAPIGHADSSTRSIAWSSTGRSPAPVGVASIAWTASMPSVTRPNTVCLPSSHGAA